MANLTGEPRALDSRNSIIIIAACGLLSGITTLGLFVYLLWSAFGWRYNGAQNGFRLFLSTEAGRYLVSLLLADLCHSIAYAAGLHWIRIDKVDYGRACTFQAVFLQLGDMGTVLWIFAISLHTLIHLFLSQRPPAWFSPTLLGLGWIVIIMLPIIGPLGIAHKADPFYDGGSGLWCWVSDSYPTTQLLYFFVWAMVSLVASVVCYTLVFLRTAGYVSGGRFAPAMPRSRGRSSSRWACISAFAHDSSDQGTESQPKSSTGGSGSQPTAPHRPKVDKRYQVGKSVRKIARKLLLYPVAYAVLVLPLTISSLGNMVGWAVPLPFLVAATCVYALGGLVDSVLFIVTRRSFIRSAAPPSSRSRSRSHAPGAEAHRLEGITVTRHELTVFDLATLESTASVAPMKGDDLETPTEEKGGDGDDRPFGAYAAYAESGSDVDKPRAI